jgi:hypothetical protein
MSLERDLRQALRRVDPPAGFAEAVLSRLEPGRGAEPPLPRRAVGPTRWLPLGLAASLVAAALGGAAWLEQERHQQGAMAADQVRQALRISSQQLNDIRARALERVAPQGETR